MDKAQEFSNNNLRSVVAFTMTRPNDADFHASVCWNKREILINSRKLLVPARIMLARRYLLFPISLCSRSNPYAAMTTKAKLVRKRARAGTLSIDNAGKSKTLANPGITSPSAIPIPKIAIASQYLSSVGCPLLSDTRARKKITIPG